MVMSNEPSSPGHSSMSNESSSRGHKCHGAAACAAWPPARRPAGSIDDAAPPAPDAANHWPGRRSERACW